MFSFGDFAALGRVSVRMLRHYDAIGLLRPARVDPATGYRFYTAEQLGADASRLMRIEARLRLIEIEGPMNTEDVVLKSVPPMRVAELSAVSASYGPEHIGPTLTPLYPQLMQRMQEAGTQMTGAPIAYYDAAPGEQADAVTVHAAFPVSSVPDGDHGFAVVDLPGLDAAATLIHHGPMAGLPVPLRP